MANKYLTEGPVTQELINLILSRMAKKTDSGGHSAFFGQVRADETDGERVKAIEYSAYEEMVKPEADKICKSILSEFSDTRSVYIVHSTGIVKAGEISLFVLVSAGHRLEAIQACSKTFELVKERFPVWKKEILEDDFHVWK